MVSEPTANEVRNHPHYGSSRTQKGSLYQLALNPHMGNLRNLLCSQRTSGRGYRLVVVTLSFYRVLCTAPFHVKSTYSLPAEKSQLLSTSVVKKVHFGRSGSKVATFQYKSSMPFLLQPGPFHYLTGSLVAARKQALGCEAGSS